MSKIFIDFQINVSIQSDQLRNLRKKHDLGKKGITIFQGLVGTLPHCNPYLDKKSFHIKK